MDFPSSSNRRDLRLACSGLPGRCDLPACSGRRVFFSPDTVSRPGFPIGPQEILDVPTTSPLNANGLGSGTAPRRFTYSPLQVEFDRPIGLGPGEDVSYSPAMAKGNDGNLLQHCVEAELAIAIAGEGPLHVVLTHGMAPFEKLNANSSSSTALFKKWWNYDGTAEDLPQVIRAYQTSRKLDYRYPNSAEILRVLLGPDRISGFLCQ